MFLLHVIVFAGLLIAEMMDSTRIWKSIGIAIIIASSQLKDLFGLSTGAVPAEFIGKLEVLRISPVLGVHTGPGIVGAAVLPMETMKDLM